MKKILLFAIVSFLWAVSAHAAEPLYLDKAYIKQDTTWGGTVYLKGQNVVKRGTTLTILPGTVVKFLWSDEDGDNIGDGELTVEGDLIAKGTKDKPILFTSGQEHPKPKDWTFVQLSVSKKSDVEYCIFEYAFSGLQVHYSTASVKNCVFRNNFEGMRFSTTDVMIERNDFLNNAFGIRYESHGSRTTVAYNRFKGNGQAFFPVQKSDPIVKIHDNNIEGCKEYAVKLGVNQKEDLDYTDNWWGTADAARIDAGIYDHSKDDTLGQVKYVPFLKEPVKDCGVQ